MQARMCFHSKQCSFQTSETAQSLYSVTHARQLQHRDCGVLVTVHGGAGWFLAPVESQRRVEEGTWANGIHEELGESNVLQIGEGPVITRGRHF